MLDTHRPSAVAFFCVRLPDGAEQPPEGCTRAVSPWSYRIPWAGRIGSLRCAERDHSPRCCVSGSQQTLTWHAYCQLSYAACSQQDLSCMDRPVPRSHAASTIKTPHRASAAAATDGPSGHRETFRGNNRSMDQSLHPQKRPHRARRRRRRQWGPP
jgi:hypothetical protein